MSRSRLPANKRNYQIQRLQSSHREMLRLSALGKKRQAIAEELGVTPATVTNVVNSDLGRAQGEVLAFGRDKAVTDISQKLQDLLPTAIQVMGDVAKGTLPSPAGSNITPALRYKAAESLLGRGGFVAPVRGQVDHTHNHKLTADDINLIKTQAKQIKGNIIDVEVIESKPNGVINAENSNP